VITDTVCLASVYVVVITVTELCLSVCLPACMSVCLSVCYALSTDFCTIDRSRCAI